MDRRAFVSLLVGLGARSRDVSAQAGEPLRLRYGGDSAFAPFESLDSQGQPKGFQIELLAQLSEETGITFDIQLQPWSRTQADFRTGALDVVAMVDTEARRRWALFARGHATPALGVYQRQGVPPVQALHELRDRRLVVTTGEAMRDTLAHDLTGLPEPSLRVADAAHALAAIADGRADVALLPRAYAEPLLAQGRAPGVVAGHLSLAVQSYAFAVAPGREDLRDRLQRGMDRLESSGRLEALRVRWLSSHRDVAQIGDLQQQVRIERTWAWAGGMGAAGLGVALWRRHRRLVAERRRRAALEGELHRAEALLDRAFTRHADPMLLIERASRTVRDANAALAALVGQPLVALVGRSLDDLASHLDPGTRQALTRLLDDTGTLEAAPVRLMRADGQPRDVLVSGEAMRIGGVEHSFCILRDVTEPLSRDRELKRGFDEAVAQMAAEARAARQGAQAARGEAEAARGAQALAEQRLAEFTRVVPHDLKTPLNAVQGFAGLLKLRLQQGRLDEAKAYGEQIEQAARRMDEMIVALTQLAQVVQQPLQRQVVDMRKMAQETADLLAVGQDGKRGEVRIDALPPAQGDTALLTQVWQNLLGNAIKFSARVAEPKVRVDSHRDERGTWYRITDNGVGFDMARADRLFLPFQRMPGTQAFEGTGVGLSLVRRIVEHHGGSVRLRSAPGVGTVAEFTLDAPT